MLTALLAAALAATTPTEEAGPAALLPAAAWAVLEVPDVPGFLAGFGETSLGRFLADEEVADFLAVPLAALDAALAEDDLPTLAAVDAAGLEALFVALLPPGEGPDLPVPVLGFRTSSPLPLELGDAVVESAHGAFRVLAPPGAAERLRAGDRLADDPVYRRGRAATDAGAGAPFLHVAVGAIARTVRQWDDALSRTSSAPPLSAVSALSWTADVTGGVARTRTFVAVDPEDETTRALWPTRPLEADTLRLVPRDARGFQFGCVDLRVAARLAESMPGVSTMDGSAELLEHLGETLGVVLLPSHSPTAPSLVFLAALRSAGAADGIVDLFFDAAAVSTVEIAGCAVHQVEVIPGVAFAVTEVDGWLLGSADPTALRRALEHLDSGSPSILDRADVAAALDAATAQDRPITGCSWVDVPALAASGLELAGPLLLLGGGDLPVDPSLLPVPEVATETLAPTFAVSRAVEGGWRFEREGPLGADLLGFGTLSFVGMLGAIAATVVENVQPRVAEAKRSAARASVETLKFSVTLYLMNNSRLPESLEVLLLPDPNNDGEAYVQARWLIDPWGNPYEYTVDGPRSFVIVSLGADGLPGGEGEDADIASRRPGRDR